jgi:GNAT superfamily N-acetyltransferase
MKHAYIGFAIVIAMNTPNADPGLIADEVCALREESGWDHDNAEWAKCLERNLLNVSVRDVDGTVIAVGFLSGNVRHAELTDLVVHPSHRNAGHGRSIVAYINEYAKNNQIKYYGLTYDKTFPWLKEFYESEGFQIIDFAMWYKDSLT